MTPKEQIAEDISRFYDDPLGYVMYNWDWDQDKSIQLVKLQSPWKERYKCEYGPDVWACEYLDQLGAEIRKRKFDGVHAVDPIQFSTGSGHGIGKTVMVAWLIKFIADTRPFSKGTVTANTDIQLRTKTWAALGSWHAKSLTKDWFTYAAGRGSMSFKSVTHPTDWFCSAQTSREENSESFAGQHAANSTSYYIFDEASGIPDKIFEVRKGGLMTGEPMAFDFGNCTRNTGAFYDNMEGKQKHRYIRRFIDSRTVAITNKAEIQKMVDDYGEDSDIVRVRVKGQFPKAASAQFITRDVVEMAQEREVVVGRTAALVIGVDPARFGDDDTVIWARHGDDARSFPPERYNGLDGIQVASRVIAKVKFFENLGKSVDAIFVDGNGIGASVVDQLRNLGYNPIDVQFGGAPTDRNTYRYKVDECWGEMREAIKTRLALPDAGTEIGKALEEQLTQRLYGYTLKGQLNLETKKQMKERGLGSPDIADALALTYAFEVAAISDQDMSERAHGGRVIDDYDPLEHD